VTNCAGRFIFGVGVPAPLHRGPKRRLPIDGPFSRPAFSLHQETISGGRHMIARTDIEHDSPPHSGTAFFDCRGACLRANTDRGLTMISISGQIDASNVDEVIRRASEMVSDCDALIVDLAKVDFIACDGRHALFALNMHCAVTGKTWALIASRAVSRLLRVADRDGLLPAVASATEALLVVGRSNRDHRLSLRLVSPIH
jgi:anti-anti-sigma factor